MTKEDAFRFQGATFASMVFGTVSDAIGEKPEKVNWGNGIIQLLWFSRGFEMKISFDGKPNVQAGVMTGKTPPLDMVARVETAIETVMKAVFGENIERGMTHV